MVYGKSMTVIATQSREAIMDFLRNNGVGVLATASKDGKAHAATIYVTYDDLANLYFITKQDTQKNRNLRENPYAAIALYDAKTQTTLQASGQVTQVTDMNKIDSIFHEVSHIALKTSQSGIPPTTQLMAGGYLVYELMPLECRLLGFSRRETSTL